MQYDELNRLLKELKLPAILANYGEFAKRAAKEEWSHECFLYELAVIEWQARTENRIQRLLRTSRLPLGKTLDTLERNRLPRIVNRHIDTLIEGSFLDRAENILVFGNPGSGKTHTVCAICHELVSQGRKILFKNCELLVQELLIAKRDLKLSQLLRKLRRFDALLIDDIGYVQQNREEMEVLFTLLADRYERASTIITSNLAFSEWERIFRDPMTTAAAIDRLVHHSIILELNISSFRLEQAKQKEEDDDDE